MCGTTIKANPTERRDMERDRDQFDELDGAPFKLASLLDYQDGAIVSRTLLDKETATLTAFAVDEGQSISEHTAPHDALLQILDGTATVTIGDDAHEVTAGEALVIPAEEPHALDAPSRFKMFLIMAR